MNAWQKCNRISHRCSPFNPQQTCLLVIVQLDSDKTIQATPLHEHVPEKNLGQVRCNSPSLAIEHDFFLPEPTPHRAVAWIIFLMQLKDIGRGKITISLKIIS